MECVVCNTNFSSRRKSAKYCSPKCRIAHYRNRDTVTESSVTNDTVTLSKDELYFAINQYPQDTWKTSPEFKELKRRLKSMTVEELKEQGYFLPAWKENNQVEPWKDAEGSTGTTT